MELINNTLTAMPNWHLNLVILCLLQLFRFLCIPSIARRYTLWAISKVPALVGIQTATAIACCFLGVVYTWLLVISGVLIFSNQIHKYARGLEEYSPGAEEYYKTLMS